MSDGTHPITRDSLNTSPIDVEDLSGTGAGPERQRLQVAGRLLAQVAEVLNTLPVGTEYGLLTRGIGAATEATIGNRFTGGKNTSAVQISASGDNTIYTPANGKTLTLFWIALGTPDTNSATVTAIVKLGSKVVYRWPLPPPGAFSHWEPVTASNPNDALIVNLSGAQTVQVNYTTTEA